MQKNCFIFSAHGWGKGKVSGCAGKVKFQVSNRWWRWAWNVSHHHGHHRCTSLGHRLGQYHSPARHHLNASDTFAAVQMDVELASNSHANGSSRIPENLVQLVNHLLFSTQGANSQSSSDRNASVGSRPRGVHLQSVAVKGAWSAQTSDLFLSAIGVGSATPGAWIRIQNRVKFPVIANNSSTCFKWSITPSSPVSTNSERVL